MNNRIDFEYLTPLLEEIFEVFSLNTFLNGNTNIEKIMMSCDNYEYSYVVTNIDVFLQNIDINNEETFFTELESSIIDYVLDLYVSIGNYTLEEDKNKISLFERKIISIPSKKQKVENYINYISQKYNLDEKKKFSLHQHFVCTISRHISAIIEMRTITLSKRFIPLELVLEAYRHGLYPFGWSSDDDILFCVNPYHE
jgi:hypothetical protein